MHEWLFFNPFGKVLIIIGISSSPDLRVQHIQEYTNCLAIVWCVGRKDQFTKAGFISWSLFLSALRHHNGFPGHVPRHCLVCSLVTVEVNRLPAASNGRLRARAREEDTEIYLRHDLEYSYEFET